MRNAVAAPRNFELPGSDGSLIRGQVFGQGPAVVLTNGFSCPTFYWDGVMQALAGRATLVSWDFKGHGRSDPAKTEAGASIEGAAADLLAVMDAAGVEEASLLAFSVGCQVVLEAMRQAPQRARGLGLLFGSFERPFDTLFDAPSLSPLFRALLGEISVPLGRQLLRASAWAAGTGAGNWISHGAHLIGAGASPETMAPFYKHLTQLDPQSWLWMARSAAGHSAASLLPSLALPVLVVAGGEDQLTPPSVGRAMAAAIPNASWAYYPKASHTGLLDESEAVASRVKAFLEAHQLL